MWSIFGARRESHPEIINPVRVKNHENRRVDWLSYKNLIDWNKRVKEFLVAVGMANDKPGLIRKYHILLSGLIVMLNTDHHSHCSLR